MNGHSADSGSESDDFIPSTSRRARQRKKAASAVKQSSCKRPRLSSSSQQRQQGSSSLPAVAPQQQPQNERSHLAAPASQSPEPAPCVLHPAAAPPLAAPAPAAAPWQQQQQQEASTQHEASPKLHSSCPVCGTQLGRISDTEAGRAAHVNACLDAAAAEEPQQESAAALAVDLTTQEDVQDERDECDDLHEWLLGIDAAEVADVFRGADIDLSVLPHLNDNDLQELGIADNELRSRILRAAAAAAAAAAAGPAPSTQQQPGQQDTDEEQQQLCSNEVWPDGELLHSQDCGEELWDEGAYDEQQWQQGNEQQQQRGEGQRQQGGSESVQWQEGDDVFDQQLDWQQQQQQGTLPQPRQGWQQQWQRQQQQPGPHQWPLQAVDINQQQQHRALLQQPRDAPPTARPAGPLQSSITGFVVQQQQQARGNNQQQQQQGDAKEQWRALFRRPKQPLGIHNPAQQRAEPRQAQLSAQGRVVRAAEPQPPSAAAEAEAAAASGGPQHQQQLVPAAARQAPGLPSWWPAWRRLPGTNIVVDCFGRSAAAAGPNRTWVLSHFHADHYMGLSRTFRQGIIYCTPITAALVRLKLKVPPERLRVIELGQEVEVEGTRLQLIDANHCPGAAMIVAQPPGNAPPVLHTGDARLTPEATRSQPALQALVGRAVLVLDTTYADSSYCFPPQQDVLDWVLKAVKAELFNPRCLFLFGTYTIGKERLFLHVASALRRKVYVAAAKRSILSCLDLPPHLAQLLTTNHLEASIHAVPMRQVTLESMESLLLRYKGRYTAVVGFKPTGWSHAGGSGRSGQGSGSATTPAAAAAGPSRSSLSIKPNRRRSQRGTVVLYQVPYSEHSSCAELCSFVQWFRPLRIIPSVNNDNGPKLRAMMAAVTARSGPTTGPIDAFARRQQQQQGAVAGMS